MIEEIRALVPDEGGALELLAIVVRGSDRAEPGTTFLTDATAPLQVALLGRKDGAVIKAHYHNGIDRSAPITQEVVGVRRGLLLVGLYDSRRRFVTTRALRAGDFVLLAAGGHEFEAVGDVEAWEIKNGPYPGDRDKTYFEPARADGDYDDGVAK